MIINNPYFSVLPILKDKKIDLSLVKDFLTVSKSDFEASKQLYKEKFYSISINLLQQSIEKLTKAYILKMGMITKDELLEISHHTPKAFMKLLQDKGVIQIHSHLKNLFSKSLEENKLTLKSVLDIEEEEYATLSKEQIINFILQVKNYDLGGVDKLLANPNLVIKAFEKLYPDKKVKDHIKIKDFSVVLPFAKGLQLLLPLSIISYPHYFFTKYPDKIIKPKDYNENMGIVQAYPSLIEDVEFCINSLANLLEVSKSNPK